MPINKIFTPIRKRDRGISTRRSLNLDVSLNTTDWIADTDYDDLYSISVKDSNGKLISIPIEYKVIISFLIKFSLPSCSSLIREDSIINNYLDENDVLNTNNLHGRFTPLKIQIKNIERLYHNLKSYPSSNEYVSNDIILYRGFNKTRYNDMIKDLNIKLDSTIITPTFLSTSVFENTAFRFATDNYIVWKIIVPKNKLKVFNYTFLGDKIIDIDNLDLGEAEILLNIGAKLNCIDIEKKYKKTYLVPQFDGSEIEDSKVCKLITFEFQGWESKSDKFFSEMYKCLEDPKEVLTKVYTKSTKKNPTLLFGKKNGSKKFKKIKIKKQKKKFSIKVKRKK